MATTLDDMLTTETKSEIYARALVLADDLGVNTESWVAGDPTRSLYHFLSEIFEVLEQIAAGLAKSGFLGLAENEWLTILADQLFDVERVEATYAATSVTLTNGGGGLYVIEAGDVTVKSSTSDKTYTNTSGGTLASGPATTLTLDFVADEAGAESSALATEIDTLVTGMLGVTCSNATAAVGLDEEDDESVVARCKAKLAALSPNGAKDAYSFVVQSSDLTGTTENTKARTVSDEFTGAVKVSVAGPTGAVTAGDVDLCTPNCITSSVENSTNELVTVTYQVWLYDDVGETLASIEEKVEIALLAMFAAEPIGGDVIPPATTGKLYVSNIAGVIKGVFPLHTFRVVVTSPAADVAMSINDVAKLNGVPGATVTLIEAP
jgi:uncharacterized protein YcfL